MAGAIRTNSENTPASALEEVLDYSRLASPTGFEAKDQATPPSEADDHTRKDNELREESDDGNRRE